MTRPPLLHVYPQWRAPFSDPTAPPEDFVQTWDGSMRLVRNPKRARLLRRRGVPLLDTGERTRRGCTVFAWFVELPQ